MLVGVDVAVGVLVGVAVGVAVGVLVGVCVGLLVGVVVGVLVGVNVGEFVGVAVGVLVGVAVGVLVGVLVGVGVGAVQVTSALSAHFDPSCLHASSCVNEHVAVVNEAVSVVVPAPGHRQVPPEQVPTWASVGTN